MTYRIISGFSSTKYFRRTFSFINVLPLSSIVPLTKIPKIMLHNGKVNLSELKGDGNTTINLYQQAVYQLNCLQSNTQIISAAINLKKRKNRQDVLEEMMESCRYRLTNCIHIAGTKGKGSTCAFLESILRQLGYKTGFYSSPHLIHVRERIQINGHPISEELFAKYFFHVFNNLKDSLQNQEKMPGYFKFLTIMAFYIFYVEKVDVAIVEVGIGGENDCTNIIQNPIVCGITTLDLDHTSILGSTIPEIAWHKAGIAKSNCTLLTVEQPPEAIEYCAQWFKENSFKNNNKIQRLLIFHCTGYRDSLQLLPVFKIENNNNNNLLTTNRLSSTKANAHCFSCISQTLEWVTQYSLNMAKDYELHVLITGSLHLVGDTL
uniref:tetrahydrofolate synthase n=1 Tax=Meloidogyne floridensis TaxID=298350 RepID=A0A915P8H4_9BILA